ncbi:hypothetical protein WA538_002765 [Blastocystis sp. DL]
MGSSSVTTHIVDVLDSKWTSLPGANVGILGIGEMSCNPTCVPPIYHDVMKSLHPDYTEKDMKVSLCFGRHEGLLTFGNYDPSLRSSSPIQSTQRPNEIGYTFDLQDMRLNNDSYTGMTALGFNRVVLLETTFKEIRIPRDLFELYVKEMKSAYGALEGVADGSVFEGVSVADISKYPTFDLQIPGALLHFPPQLYFLKEDGRYTLQIVQNDYENTVQVGLAALRGFVTEFLYEHVSFASVNPSFCGFDADGAVGTVEWAPGSNKNSPFHPAIVVSIVFCVICILLLLFLCRDQGKKQLKPMERPYVATPAEPFRDTQGEDGNGD